MVLKLIVEKPEEKFLSWIEKKFHNANPDAKRKFLDKIEDSTPTTTEQEYFVGEDSKEFGLTKGDYEFLLSDIEQAIEDANRKYGNGEAGYIDNHGNFYPFPDADKPRKIKSKSKFRPIMFATAVNENKIEGVNSNG